LFIVILSSLLVYCEKQKMDPVAQKKREVSQAYTSRMQSMEQSYQEDLIRRQALDSLRFLKVTMLGESFGPDSLHVDSLICLSESYDAQRLWQTLKTLDYSDEWACSDARALTKRLRQAMQKDGCLFGGLEPTLTQLQMVEDSCFLYDLRHSYERALERVDSFSVESTVGYLIARDTIPGFLHWLGTSREDLEELRRQGWQNGAVHALRRAYAESPVQRRWDDGDIREANQCRLQLNMSVEELAKQADVPIAWVHWAFQAQE